jgi:hypothetical protein
MRLSLRQPGYPTSLILRRTRGFASPDCSGFAFFGDIRLLVMFLVSGYPISVKIEALTPFRA